MRCATVLLLWWFLANAGGTPPRIDEFGPFGNDRDCYVNRAWVLKQGYKEAFYCWNDTRTLFVEPSAP